MEFMIERMFLLKALEIQKKIVSVQLNLITDEKICGYVGTGSTCELAKIAIHGNFLLTLNPSAIPGTYYFEITLDLPF